MPEYYYQIKSRRHPEDKSENGVLNDLMGWESKDIADCVHRIQGIIAISECKANNSKLFNNK
jgi:hypothetical protein